MILRILGCVVGAIVLLSLVGCSKDSSSSDSSKHVFSPLGIDGVADVILTDIQPAELPGHGITVLDARVNKDSLVVLVQYGGGCFSHDFSCYMSPAAFIESDPPQANLFVLDNTTNDFCEAIVTDSPLFDLSPVADLYLQQHKTPGEIILNIHELSSGVPVLKFSVTFYPTE